MIVYVGDVHAKFDSFLSLLETLPSEAIVIQVGDFGLWPKKGSDPSAGFDTLDVPTSFPRKVYMIEGNHEFYPYFNDLTEPTEIRQNLIYVPRGTILEIDGKKIGFLGGAESIDKHMRREGVDWFREESIRPNDMWKFPPEGSIDVLVTHTPPAFAVRALIGGAEPDPSSKAVEQIWDGFDRPMLVAGHMHVTQSFGNVHVLEELGVLIQEDITSVERPFRFRKP